MKCGSISSYLSYLLFSLVLLLLYPSVSRAYTQLPVDISSTGYVKFECPSDLINIGWFHWQNTYPASTTLNSSATLGSVCYIIANNYGTLERGYINGTTITNDGNYWVQIFGVPPVSNTYYFTATRSGGVWINTGIVLSDTSSRFTSFTVSTTTGTVNITGYWSATSTEGISQQLEFYQESINFGRESYQSFIATTTGFFNWTFPYRDTISTSTSATTTAPIGSKIDFYATISQLDDLYATSPFELQNPLYKQLLVSTTTSILSAYDISTGIRDLENYPEYECGIANIIGCIKNAFIWAFYPTADTVNNYNNFLTLIQSKPPAGYFTVVSNNLKNLSATSTKAVTITIPSSIKNVIFNPFDIGLASILWFYFIINFYKRLKHITI